jgi:hypothetical protein
MLALSLVFVLSLLPSAAVCAQEQAAPTADAWTAVTAVEHGDELAVKLKNGRTLKGRSDGVSDTLLRLKRGGKSTDINRADVLRVYRVVGKSHKKGTVTGAIVGGSIGGVLGGIGCSDEEFCFSPEYALISGALLAGIGALIGFAASGGHKRVLIYDAR